MENKENIFPSLGYVCFFFKIPIRLQEVSHFITLDAFFLKTFMKSVSVIDVFSIKKQYFDVNMQSNQLFCCLIIATVSQYWPEAPYTLKWARKWMDFGYKILIKNLINVCCNIFNLMFDVESHWYKVTPILAAK